ncbi:2-oxo-tetronate isomerase [Elioraea rosea]|uniref:2-oxo-tetronate isomerase n=1 Tax=Elioraea rosea TaxID=2492390 RepID=UPI001183E2EA|nr:2-oxo-tetronate isomerase [Elioraea rosea]
MPKFAANLSMMYTDEPFLNRFARAAGAGFHAVEFLFPYDYSPGEVTQAARAAGVQVVLFNTVPGDWTKGERGLAAQPGREKEFVDGVAKALDYAAALGCPNIHAMAGLVAAGADREAMGETYRQNLATAAAMAAKAKINVLIEPINTRDIPGFFLNRTEEAAAIIADVGAPNLKIQFDIYHRQIMQGDLARAIAEHLPLIAHMQLADNPGRNEPGTGEINYPFLFSEIDRLGFEGWIGCEYKPKGDTDAGLDWFAPFNG